MNKKKIPLDKLPQVIYATAGLVTASLLVGELMKMFENTRTDGETVKQVVFAFMDYHDDTSSRHRHEVKQKDEEIKELKAKLKDLEEQDKVGGA